MLKRILNSPTMMSWASYFVRFGSAIFVLPLILKMFTDIETSFWFFINTIIGFAMLADSGFGPTLVRAVSYFRAGADYLPRNKKEFDEADKIAQGEPNLEKLKNLLSTANRIYILLALFAVVMLSTGGLAASWNILQLSGNQLDLWIAFLIVIPYSAFMILTVKWSSFMRGLGFIALEARFGALQGVVRIITFVVFLLFRLGPAYLIGYMMVESMVKFSYMRWFVLRWFRRNNTVPKNRMFFDKVIFRSLWSATWRTGVMFWGAYAIQSGTSLLGAQLKDTALMADFLLTMRIINFVLNISRAPFYTNVPKIYSLAAKKNLPELRKKASQYMFLGFSVMVLAIAFVATLGNPSLALIGITDKQFLPVALLLLIAVTEILDLHASFHATIYTSTNHVPFVLPATISGGLILLAGFLVMPKYGLMGILMAKFIIQFFVNVWFAPMLSLRLLKWPFFRYIYQFPYYGVTFLKETFMENVLRKAEAN